jgi:heavy metal translocating P-type ATPase
VGPGELVPGGSICGESSIDLIVAAPACASLLFRVADHVAHASGRRGPAPEVADALARLFIPFVFVVSAVTLLAWLGHGLALGPAFQRALTVLVVSCPCALGIAAPLCRVVAAGALARRGIIVRGEGALDQVAAARLIAFDKTGTLTEGRPTLLETLPQSAEVDEAHKVLVALEERSTHAVARAIREAMPAVEDAPRATDLRPVPGCGVAGEVGGAPAFAGKPEWVESLAGPAPAPLRALVTREQEEGRIAILLAWAERKWAAFSFGDSLRPEVPAAIRDLHKLGLRTTVLSGDSQRTTAAVTSLPGIQGAVGDCLPEDKARWLETAASETGCRVLFVGDGINDAPGLAVSVGIAVASGTDFARETADVLLLEPGLAPLPDLLRTARLMRTCIRQNFAWATVYNAVCIPLAAMGLLTPVWAAAAMVGSGLLVVLNAMRLQGARPPDPQGLERPVGAWTDEVASAHFS